MVSEPVFQVSLPGEPEADDVLGLWQPVSPAALAPSGAIEAGEIAAATLWRAELPSDIDAADALLEQQQNRVTALSRALPAAQSQLKVDLAQLSAAQHAAPGELSFSLADVSADDPFAILAAARQYSAPLQTDAVDFGLFDFLKPDRRQVDDSVNLFGRFTRQVRQAVDGFAQVETVIGGRHLGRTRAAWSGDIHTLWVAGALPDERRQHEQVLAQALATRQGWMRFLLLVAGGVTRVAGVIAAGPFSPVAIWAAWNYFQKVLKAYREAVRSGAPPA